MNESFRYQNYLSIDGGYKSGEGYALLKSSSSSHNSGTLINSIESRSRNHMS